MKHYVVWKGHTPGVYAQWAEAKQQIDNFKGALYKSFPDRVAALTAFQDGPNKHLRPITTNTAAAKSSIGKPNPVSISVDAACSGNPGLMEYRGVHTATGEEIFRQGPFEQGTNNIGEFLGLVHGLWYMDKHGLDWPIYTDSVTAMAWVRNKMPKTTLEKTKANAILFDKMDKAVQMLKSNNFKTTILKWETEFWGEIPADFGRK